MLRSVACSKQGQASLLCLARTASDLWKQEIDTERRILVLKEALELGDLLAKHVWSVSYAADDADSSCIRDGSGQLRTSSDVHACQHDRVVDLQKICGGGLDLLCKACQHFVRDASG